MSLDRLQSVPGRLSLSPENTTTGFAGSVSFGGQSGHVEGAAAAAGGALFTTPTVTSGAVPALVTGGLVTVTHNGCGVAQVSCAAGVAGGVVQPGTRSGQMLVIINTGAGALTFAAVATSNVANGTSANVPILSALALVWNALDSRWYDVG